MEVNSQKEEPHAGFEQQLFTSKQANYKVIIQLIIMGS